MFETDRLILRAFRESDWEYILKLWNNPTTQRFLWLDYVTPRGDKFVKDVLKPGMENATLYVIITSKDKRQANGEGEVMGYCEMAIANPKNREGHLEIGLLPEWQGMGYGTEALRFVVDHGFREFQLHRMSLGVLEGNAAARAVYTKMQVPKFAEFWICANDIAWLRFTVDLKRRAGGGR
ncbi:acyl-CoA N-acyltransferase [Neolentinus lepideus HHB14362 ss-1]|uniref:Acyl-CoA N-acyltransferase n=1 Tax=Neolentinus lepideus HHB14362 ss-1 TaxID=1314782 RepID=A0A165NDT0_9AGAM|nr:acyl-CoA N-acyltransferase [Neolentinus lepideus HHB14362 ss-1]